MALDQIGSLVGCAALDRVGDALVFCQQCAQRGCRVLARVEFAQQVAGNAVAENRHDQPECLVPACSGERDVKVDVCVVEGDRVVGTRRDSHPLDRNPGVAWHGYECAQRCGFEQHPQFDKIAERNCPHLQSRTESGGRRIGRMLVRHPRPGSRSSVRPGQQSLRLQHAKCLAHRRSTHRERLREFLFGRQCLPDGKRAVENGSADSSRHGKAERHARQRSRIHAATLPPLACLSDKLFN